MNFLQLKIKEKNYALMTFILFWAGLVIMSSLYVTIPLISVFSQKFFVSEKQAVWTSSAFSFCFAVGCLIFGPLSDRYGRKKIIFCGLMALTIISLLLGFSKKLLLIIVLRGIQGAAAATFSPVALSYAVELFPPHKRVGTIGCISTGFLMAGIIGQVFSSSVNSHLGWNFIFIILASIYFVTALLILFFIPNRPANGISIITAFKQMKKVLGQRSLRYAYVVAAVLLLSFVGMYTSLGKFLSSSQFGFNNQQILYVRLVGVLGMLLSPLAGNLVKKFGVLSVLRSALTLAITGLIILGISTNMIVMIIASVVFVSGIAIAIPSLISLISELGGSARGAAVSIYTFVLFMGASIGPILTIGLLETGNYIVTFLALALCVLIGLLATFFIKVVSLDEQTSNGIADNATND